MSLLANHNILVVEDEFLIALALCDMLKDAFAIVIGPAASVAEAMRLIEENDVRVAILDVNLNGQLSDPIAEVLTSRRIPFVFTTGYGSNELTERFNARTVAKPYTWAEIEEQLGFALASCTAEF